MRVAVSGACGLMGKAVIEELLKTPDMQLVGALTRKNHTNTKMGLDAGDFCGYKTGIKITDNINEALNCAEVLLDFSTPSAIATHIDAALDFGVKLVIGTTGMDLEEQLLLKTLIAKNSPKLAIVLAPNMSAGMNKFYHLLCQAAAMLRNDYDIAVLDNHHKAKVDTPSGTAKYIKEMLEKNNPSSKNNNITIASLRGGDGFGEHTVIFAGIGQSIEIKHKATSRTPYAKGAICAARFLQKHSFGLFNMEDVFAAQI